MNSLTLQKSSNAHVARGFSDFQFGLYIVMALSRNGAAKLVAGMLKLKLPAVLIYAVLLIYFNEAIDLTEDIMKKHGTFA